MVKLSKKSVLFFLTLILSVTIGMTALAADTTGQGTASSGSSGSTGTNKNLGTGGIRGVVDAVGSQTSLPNFDSGHASQNYQAGASQLTSTIYFLLDFFKYILGGIAVLMIIISGMRLILSARQVNDVMNREKETLRFAFIGLLIIIVADQVVRTLFGEYGETFRTSTDMQMTAEAGSKIASGVSGLIRIFLPSFAILFFVIAAFRILTSRGDNEKYTKAKKQITWAVMGLILAGLAEIIVFRIIFPDQGARIPDTAEFAKLLVTITNFITGFVSTIAVSMIIYAGYLYVISVGGDGAAKAKKIVTGALIGLLISMAAFALVNTFVKVESPTNVGTQTQTQTPVPGQ